MSYSKAHCVPCDEQAVSSDANQVAERCYDDDDNPRIDKHDCDNCYGALNGVLITEKKCVS